MSPATCRVTSGRNKGQKSHHVYQRPLFGPVESSFDVEQNQREPRWYEDAVAAVCRMRM